MIRILLVDDHEMVRIGVSTYLKLQQDMEVVGEAENGEEAVTKALALRPDIILMDMVMPKKSGAEATADIIKQWPEAKIIIVTSFLDDDKLYPALEAGASSYILKTSNASRIADAIRQTYVGDTVLEPEVAARMMKQMRMADAPFHEQLTTREMDVLLLLAEGLTNQQIAEELYIGLKTVKTHVSNILSKLDVRDRTQAVVYAFNHQLVKPKSE